MRTAADVLDELRSIMLQGAGGIEIWRHRTEAISALLREPVAAGPGGVTADQLTAVSGVGPALAAKIVAHLSA